jgi:ABC-type enterobactin transport system permease subunit
MLPGLLLRMPRTPLVAPGVVGFLSGAWSSVRVLMRDAITAAATNSQGQNLFIF